MQPWEPALCSSRRHGTRLYLKVILGVAIVTKGPLGSLADVCFFSLPIEVAYLTDFAKGKPTKLRMLVMT